MRRRRIEEEFLKDEISDYLLYRNTARYEKDTALRKLITRLMRTELRHANVWASILGVKGAGVGKPTARLRLRVWMYMAVRRLLGIAFLTKLLERREIAGLEDYRTLARGEGFDKATMGKIKAIIKDEEGHEQTLVRQTQQHKAVLDYTRSIVFGMNDGLVEILAVIAGVAMVATASFVVAITGIIVGISGTLSMAAGAYISSKSERVVKKSLKEKSIAITSPAREAYYTGIFYFIGAIVATYPFILGYSGYIGIIEAVVSVAVVLSVASVIIAIISDTSVRTRVLEMLAISLGAALATALIGYVVRVVFGVAIS